MNPAELDFLIRAAQLQSQEAIDAVNAVAKSLGKALVADLEPRQPKPQPKKSAR